MKLIYDSGPMTLIDHVLALVGAILAFGMSLLLAYVSFWLFAQAGFQLGAILCGIFVLSLSALIFILGVNVVAPVFRRFNVRVYINGCNIEVRRSFPWKIMDQVFDLNRINTIKVIHARKGGSSIDVLYRFGENGPSLKDSQTIGPFYRWTQAEAVAAAIQAVLLPENFDPSQIAQNKQLNYRVALRFIFGAFIFYELIVCISCFSNWNQIGLVDKVIHFGMAAVPMYLWYRIRRNMKSSDFQNPISSQS